MIMNDVTTWAHTNSGMRLSDMPGARCLNTVVRFTTAPASAEISVSVIMSAQMSTRWPGAYCGPESGTYANHPASAPAFTSNPPQRSKPPARKA